MTLLNVSTEMDEDMKKIKARISGQLHKYKKKYSLKKRNKSLDFVVDNDPFFNEIAFRATDYYQSDDSPPSPAWLPDPEIQSSHDQEKSNLDQLYNNFQNTAKERKMSESELLKFLQSKVNGQKCTKIPLEKCDPEYARKRISDIVEYVEEISKREKTDVLTLLAFIGANYFYHIDRTKSKRFKSLLNPDRLALSLEESVYLFEHFRQGFGSKRKYTDFRREMSKFGLVFPSYDILNAYRKKLLPDLFNIHEQGIGVKLREAITLRLGRIYELPNVAEILQKTAPPHDLAVDVHVGMDGAAQQNLRQHKDSASHMFNVAFCIAEINLNKKLIYSENSNSCDGVSPWKIIPSPESQTMLQSVVPQLEIEIKELESGPILIEIDNNLISAQCASKLTFADGKIVNTLTGRGGSKCCLCFVAHTDYNTVEFAEVGFAIEIHSLQDIEQKMSKLRYDPIQEKFDTKPKDYAFRGGCTRPPMVVGQLDPSHEVPVAHFKIHAFGWYFKRFLPRIVCKSANWLGANSLLEDEFFLELGMWIKNQTGKNILKHSSDCDPGNLCREMFSTKVREVLRIFLDGRQDGLSPNEKENILKVHLYLTIFVKLTGMSRRLNVEALKKFSSDVNVFILQEYPIAQLTPSLHQVIGHLWELVQFNDGFGLGAGHSEEGLEASNRALKRLYQHHSRTYNTEVAMIDTFTKRFVETDPQVQAQAKQKTCSLCGKNGHTARSCSFSKRIVIQVESEEEQLLKSFFVEENN